LMTVGADIAPTGTDNAAASKRTAADHLIEEQIIHPPIQPARAALGH